LKNGKGESVMDNTVDLMLDGLSILFFLAFLVWDVKLLASIKRGERNRFKRRDLNTFQNLLGLLLIVYMAFVLYLGSTFLFDLTAGIILPFNGIGSPIIFSLEAIGFLGLAYLLSVTNPRKKLALTAGLSET
jgi:hypothetical protein